MRCAGGSPRSSGPPVQGPVRAGRLERPRHDLEVLPAAWSGGHSVRAGESRDSPVGKRL